MKTILCLVLGHKWQDSKPAKDFGPGEQQCSRCKDKRHHTGCNAYDEVQWRDGPLPQ